MLRQGVLYPYIPNMQEGVGVHRGLLYPSIWHYDEMTNFPVLTAEQVGADIELTWVYE